jgi:polyisoprenoid-binding protein YceI
MKTEFTAGLLVLISLAVNAAEYHVDRSASNLVKFISDAPIEDFEGITDRIDGYVFFTADQLSENDNFDSSEVHFEVELNGLDTGIGLRNRHMRENYLETDIFPYAIFNGHLTAITEKSPGNFEVIADGLMKIHGVEKPVSISGTVVADGNRYHIMYDFAVKLSDYNIEIPSLMFMKINEVIQLKLDFFVSRHEDKN